MTIKEALELLVYNELECDQHDSCDACPHHGPGGESCWGYRISAAEIIKVWLDSLPEGQPSNITLAGQANRLQKELAKFKV